MTLTNPMQEISLISSISLEKILIMPLKLMAVRVLPFLLKAETSLVSAMPPLKVLAMPQKEEKLLTLEVMLLDPSPIPISSILVLMLI